MAEYKRNHSIPRFMLEYWVDPSTTHKGIHVHEVATQRTYVSTGQGRKPFSFAITTDLYVLHATNGSRAVNLERWFSGLEDALAVFVRRVHAREPIYMSGQECMKVLMAVLGLECRSPYNMRHIQAALESNRTLRALSSDD
jgi:hypothetical protein